MIIRFFYTLLLITLIPVSVSLIFKPEIWQTFYSRLYFSRLESKGSPILKSLVKSLLSMISTEAGWLAHRAIGIFLAIFALYIFFEKLKIITFF